MGVLSLLSRKWLESTRGGREGELWHPSSEHREVEEVMRAGGRSTTGRRGRGEETYLRWSSDVDEDGTNGGRSSSGDEDEGTGGEGEKHRR
jgi:hypothetical protein